MKRFIIFSFLFLFSVSQYVNAACLLQDLSDKNVCTGGAANINIPDVESDNEKFNLQELKKMYQIPTMSTPGNTNASGFPALNQNCMFGACFPDLR